MSNGLKIKSCVRLIPLRYCFKWSCFRRYGVRFCLNGGCKISNN